MGVQPLSRCFPYSHLPLSPLVTAAEPECVCVCVCLYESVCAYLLESQGESRRSLLDISVAVGKEGFLDFYPFLFLNLGDRVGLFLYNP